MHKKSARLFAVALAMGTLSSLAMGLSGVDWTDWVSNDSTVLLSARTWQEDPDYYTDVMAIRGPISGGMCQIEARVETHDPALQQIRFLVADDLNSSGVIETSEWVVVGSAVAAQQGQVFIATTGPVLVSATRDAYRIEHTWAGWGVSHDDVIASGLDVE